MTPICSRFLTVLLATLLVGTASGCGRASTDADERTRLSEANGTTSTRVESFEATRTTGPAPTQLVTTTIPFASTSTTLAPRLRPIERALCATPVVNDGVGSNPLKNALADPQHLNELAQFAGEDSTTITTSTTTPAITRPRDARTALDQFRNDPRVSGSQVSVSVWIDGLGEVATENPDLALVPASNQKLITAIGALRLLDPNERLHTDLVATGPITDGVLHGDLVLLGGGDPTLTRTGVHSLETFANAVSAAGIREVQGRVLVDDSRYDNLRSGSGWPAAWASSVGPMSALVADRNQYRKDAAFLADPALGHGELLELALTNSGVSIKPGAAHSTLSAGVRLASLDSPTINELVTIMLLRSDNLIAELLVKEIGYRRNRQPGSTTVGLSAIREVIQQLCGPVAGIDADGSGLSTSNRRSAREFRRLLLAAELQPWGQLFISDLAVAGQPGAIGGRLTGPATNGNVRAKGGSLAITRSLSGYLTTASGRNAVFSVIVNGPALAEVEPAIDDFITNLASL